MARIVASIKKIVKTLIDLISSILLSDRWEVFRLEDNSTYTET